MNVMPSTITTNILNKKKKKKKKEKKRKEKKRKRIHQMWPALDIL